MSGPLAGLKMLDLTTVLMGPYATQILGDWGAEIIKIESLTGDVARNVGPSRHPRMGSFQLHLNRNKRSVAVNLKTPGGLGVLKRLAADADVLISNIRPKALARIGIAYDEFAKINPRLIFVFIIGYGERGRYAGKPAYDDLIQGAVGIGALNQRASRAEPRYAPLAMADRTVGLHAVGVVLAAVYARGTTGRGQQVEVPMFETMTQFVMGEHLQGATFDPPLGEPGYLRLLAKERKPYRTEDGYICALIYTDRNWKDFLTIIGRWEEMKSDPRIADITARTRHTGELYAIVEEAMATRTTAEWLKVLDEADIPAMIMHTPELLMEDPHLRDVGFFHPVDHPTEGRYLAMDVPNSWSDTKPEMRYEAPKLGADTVAVLREAGFSSEEIDGLFAAKAVGGER